MTPASEMALDGLRDLSTLKWYVIPILAFVFYIYICEIKKARQSGDWNAVFAGAALFGTDFLFETINGWIFHFTGRSALWTTPGDTALRTMVGWNIEIMFMFAVAGIIYYHTLSEKRGARILGLPDRFFWAAAYAAFCVFVECLLNAGGHLVWEYPFWERTPAGVLSIFFAAYLPLFMSPMLVISLKRISSKTAYVLFIYGLAAGLNVLAFGFFGWNY
jgi:hypothetical protein